MPTKGQLYEGGIRTPLIARWLGKTKPGSTTDLPIAFWDILPTLCEIAGVAAPQDSDGISFVPTLVGRGEQKRHEFLYWEFAGDGGQQALRFGNWKAIRTNLNKGPSELELYDLARDPNEQHNVAAEHAGIAARIERIMHEQHTPSEAFPIKGIDSAAKSSNTN